MACRHTEIEYLKEDRDKINNAIQFLVAALDKGTYIGEECSSIDWENKQTFRTRNMVKLANNLEQLNDDGNSAITKAIVGLSMGLAELEALLVKYQIEDNLYHTWHPDEPIPGESEESA